MGTEHKKKITVEAFVNAPKDVVWKLWTTPEDIVRWNNASTDWHTPNAKTDLRIGGKFLYRMEARDGSSGFDFGGIYESIQAEEHIAYSIGDGRKVEINFTSHGNETKVAETFETESSHTMEQQRAGWQAILNNFKKYTESRSWQK